MLTEPQPSATRVAIAIVESGGRYLVGIRGEDGPLPGYHEFPGGKLHADELPMLGAVRECLEETGLAVKPIALMHQCRHEYAHGAVELFFVRCRPVSGSCPPAAGNFQWTSRADLAKCRFPEANAAVIAMLAGGAE
jgi:8-oxo-dGTP diphosphatase